MKNKIKGYNKTILQMETTRKGRKLEKKKEMLLFLSQIKASM